MEILVNWQNTSNFVREPLKIGIFGLMTTDATARVRNYERLLQHLSGYSIHTIFLSVHHIYVAILIFLFCKFSCEIWLLYLCTRKLLMILNSFVLYSTTSQYTPRKFKTKYHRTYQTYIHGNTQKENMQQKQ